MKTQSSIRIHSGLFFVAVLWLVAAGTAQAQFTQNRDTIKIDRSGLPPEIQKGYRTFHAKCNECHGLDTSLKPTMSDTQWTSEVKRMQAMASAQFNDRDADQILKFLSYEESHRKAAARASVSASSDGTPEAIGKQLFESYGCSACHSVAGLGNASSSLDGVGSKRNAAELRKAVTSPASGSAMPPMEVPAKDLDNLVAYLLTLR
jgi:mono/diheme cytochrome c family protein